MLLEKWLVVRNFLSTGVAIGAVVAAMIGIPQIRTLFPMPSEYSGQPAFLIYTLVTICLFLAATWFVVWPVGESKAKNLHKPKIGIVLVALGLMSFGSVWLFPMTETTPSFLETPIRILATVMLIAWAALLIAAGYLPAWSSAQIFRSLLTLTVLGVSGEVIWWAGENLSFASLRIYSIGAACLLGFTAVTIVAFVDRLQAKNPLWPIRLLFGVSVLIAFFAFLKSPEIGKIDRSIPIALSAVGPEVSGAESTEVVNKPSEPSEDSELVNVHLVNWLTTLDKRIGEKSDPVIMVAASGGGSRAALFAALILESLKSIPTDSDDSPSITAADRVVMVSSVSGGSLASGCFTDPAYSAQSTQLIKSPKNFYVDSITELINTEANTLNSNKRFIEIHKDVWDEVLQETSEAKNSLSATPPNISLAFLQSKLVDDMCTDFMAPLLRGVISPWRERGQAVSWLWTRKLFSQAASLTTATNGDAVPPLWLCNTTHVAAGHPLVIGFPPIPQELVRPTANVEITYDFDLCQWRLDRPQAIRVSANFPWGFEVAKSPLNVIQKNGAEKSSVHVIDGGVFDNSGITSIRLVVEAIQRLADEDTAKTPSTSRKQAVSLAKLVIGKLHRCGVILLEIDSGAKPEPPGGATQLLATALSPIHALNNSTYFTSERSSSDNINSLRERLRSPRAEDLRERLIGLRSYSNETRRLKIEDEQVDTFFHVKVTCNEQDNVMTAWALPPDDKAKIFVRGMVATKELTKNLQAKFTLERETFTSLALIEDRVRELEEQLVTEQPARPELAEQVKVAIAIFSKVSEIATLQRLDDAAKQIEEYLYARKASSDQVAKTKQIVAQVRENNSSKVLKQIELSSTNSTSTSQSAYTSSNDSRQYVSPNQELIKEDFSKLKGVLRAEKTWEKK